MTKKVITIWSKNNVRLTAKILASPMIPGAGIDSIINEHCKNARLTSVDNVCVISLWNFSKTSDT